MPPVQRHAAQAKPAQSPPSKAADKSREPAASPRADFDRLLAAFVATHPHRPCHWNPSTGELFAPPAGPKGQAAREAFELRLLQEDGWIELPWQESDDAYAQARQFVAQLKPGKGRAELSRALDTAKPFRAFRAVLGKHPGLARRWEAEANAEALARLVECCVAHEVTPADPRYAAALQAWEAAQACSAPVVFAPTTPPPVRVSLGALRLGAAAPAKTGSS